MSPSTGRGAASLRRYELADIWKGVVLPRPDSVRPVQNQFHVLREIGEGRDQQSSRAKTASLGG